MSTNPIQVLSETELLGHKFTVYGTAENPLFLAKEVAEVLNYSESNSNKLTNLVESDEKVRNIITTPGGNQEVWFLTEDGLYEVLMQSRKPIAKEFKKGVKEILKAIRKTGGYLATKQDDTPEEIMARALTIAQATKKYLFLFGNLWNCSIFAVLQLTINYANGIFYTHKGTILKYRQAVSVYHRPMAMVGCSKLGYLSAFLFNNK